MRLFVLFAICILSIMILTIISYYALVQIPDFAAKAIVAGGFLTVIGTIFTTMITEISTYHKEKELRFQKKWDLIYPLINDYYGPWLSAAKSLQDSMRVFMTNKSEDNLTRFLFLIMVFYYRRLKLVTQGGSIIFLLTTEEEKKVNAAYSVVKSNLSWDQDSTPKRVSLLQNLFFKKNKLEEPYVLHKFEEDINKSKELKEIRAKLEQWVNSGDNLENSNKSITEFITTLEDSIHKFHDALNP